MVYLPFADRVEAGRLLARELSSRKTDSQHVVLALTRGGVPVGFQVADRLHIPLDIVVVRKLGVPWQPELAMGAIAGESPILDDSTIRQLGVSAEDVEDTIAREQSEMRRREELYRDGNPALDLHGQSVILVDDGLATGSTMLAAVRHVRALNAASAIIGVPVGSKDACDRLRREADDIVCLAVPDRFFAVGEWYRDFEQVSDAEAQHLLTERRSQLRKHPLPATTA
jgi:putative phosphoribosyl transferase